MTMTDELKHILPQTLDGAVRLRANLLIATARVDELKQELGADHEFLIARIEAEIKGSIEYAQSQEQTVAALSRLVERLLRQYQSANDAYQMGWEGRMSDILARLSLPDGDRLLTALQKIAIADEPF